MRRQYLVDYRRAINGEAGLQKWINDLAATYEAQDFKFEAIMPGAGFYLIFSVKAR